MTYDKLRHMVMYIYIYKMVTTLQRSSRYSIVKDIQLRK